MKLMLVVNVSGKKNLANTSSYLGFSGLVAISIFRGKTNTSISKMLSQLLGTKLQGKLRFFILPSI